MFPEGRLLDFVIVGAVALMVVGPKDLPMLMRKVGQFMARVRGMAAEFRASFDELARQSELDELRREVQALRTTKPMDYAAQAMGAQEMVSDIKGDLATAHAALNAEAPPAEASLPEPSPSEPPVTPEAAPLPPAAEIDPKVPTT
jgi:sec-independent protein translocase protein TatB